LPLRNGNLNQMAYSLFLFISDVADGDLVAWIDAQLEAAESPATDDRLEAMRAALLEAADSPATDDRLEAMRAALLEPLRCIYGVSDKVLSMALAELLLGAGQHRPRWAEVGAQMIAVDRLVHNFLRGGIRCNFKPGMATGIIGLIAKEIDAREFNSRFPKIFPRFVQHAIWRYCAGFGLDVCNGNKIDDQRPCANSICRLYGSCDRLTHCAKRP
jgi:hypothetical protein